MDGFAALELHDGRYNMTLGIASEGASIVLTIMNLNLRINGDPVFYVDAMGNHSTCGWWCIYCTLKHHKCKTQDGSQPGDLWTNKMVTWICELLKNEKQARKARWNEEARTGKNTEANQRHDPR
jgi:hypothetical protein